MSLSSSPNNNPLPNFNSTDTLTFIRSSETHLVILNLPIATKLSQGNFLAWKSQTIPTLHGHDLYRYLDESPPPKFITINGNQAINSAFNHWYKQDQLLLSWIRSSLKETILNQTVSCTTSAEIWSLLQQSFFATSRARLTELRQSFQNTTKGGTSCSEFCQRMRAIADELAVIGAPVSDEDLVIQILNGLGADFNSIVAAANAKEHLSFVELQSMLLSHESLLLSQTSGEFSLPSLQNPAALFTQSRPSTRGFTPRFGGRRFQNRTPGSRNFSFRPAVNQLVASNSKGILSRPINPTPVHFSSPNRPISNRAEQAIFPDNRPICQICSERDHNALMCWYRVLV